MKLGSGVSRGIKQSNQGCGAEEKRKAVRLEIESPRDRREQQPHAFLSVLAPPAFCSALASPVFVSPRAPPCTSLIHTISRSACCSSACPSTPILAAPLRRRRPGLSPVRVLFYIKIRALKTRRYTKSTPAPAAPRRPLPRRARSFRASGTSTLARSPRAGVRRSLDGRSSSFFFSAVFFLFFDSSFRRGPLSMLCGNVRPIIGEFGAGFGFSKIVS